MHHTNLALLATIATSILVGEGNLAGQSSAGSAQSSAAKSSSPTARKPSTFYFMDWSEIEKGRVVPVYDASRLTEEAKTNFANLKKEWNIDSRIGKHGTQPYHLARGVRIAVEKAKKTERWLIADRPWETDISGGNVLYDEGRFRCWYSTTLPKTKVGIVYGEEGRGMETNGIAMCYAESNDGIHWNKPSLKIFSINGSKENNMVSPLWIDTPFRDDHGKLEERYKAFTFEELPADEVPKGGGSFVKYGLYGVVSPDGYHWTKLPKPLIRHFCDTWNNAGWDPLLKKYVGYFRGHTGGRSITRAETDDFHNWPMPETVFCVGPEELPNEDYYSSGYTTFPGVPSIRLMFPGIYHLNTSKIDVRMTICRDGYGWNWVSRETILDNGRDGEWDSGMVFGQPDLLRLPDGRLALPYSGYNEGHETGFSTHYKEWAKQQTGIAWATWQEGRLAGVQADKTGEFYTAAQALDISEIQINARTASGGRVEFEVVQKDNILPGFSFADCVPFTGDKIWASLNWKGKNDLSELRGKKFQIHFRLKKAKIFGYRTFQSTEKTEKGSKSPSK